MPSIRHVVVVRASSSVRFAPDEKLTLRDAPVGDQRATVIIRTRYRAEGLTKPVPRELWLEVIGKMPSLDEAIGTFTNAAAFILPAIAFCANAPIDEPEPELALEFDDDGNEHRLYQRKLPDEFGFPRARRRAPTSAIRLFLRKWLEHPEAERIYRTLVQYALGLRHGAAGREILAHAHFFMATEALTKALLRDECRKTGLNEDQLAVAWSIEKKALDSEVRLRRVFNGDRTVYNAARQASDGFEHGFANYAAIRRDAEAVGKATAAGVRKAVFDLIELQDPQREFLLSEPFATPMDPRQVEEVVRGNLAGAADALALNPHAYPFIRWQFEMSDYLGDDDEGRMQFTPKDTTITPIIGPNASFQLTAFEIRRPDPGGRTTPVVGTARVRTPQEVIADIRRNIDQVRARLPAIAQSINDAQMREVCALLGERTKKMTKRDQEALQRKLARYSNMAMPYNIGLAALSGQLPLNVARYYFLERAMAASMAANGVAVARTKDAFDVLNSRMAAMLKEPKALTTQNAYAAVALTRERLIKHLTQEQHYPTLMPVLDHWYSSEECKTLVRYATQYKAKATRFLLRRPTRYTQQIVVRLCEQYMYHAGLFNQQLRLLIALDHSTREERLHSSIADINFESLLGSSKTSQPLKELAQALNRHIRNALAHGAPAIDANLRQCVFRDKEETVSLSFDELYDQTMRLTVTTLALLAIDQRLLERWNRQQIETLLRS